MISFETSDSINDTSGIQETIRLSTKQWKSFRWLINTINLTHQIYLSNWPVTL